MCRDFVMRLLSQSDPKGIYERKATDQLGKDMSRKVFTLCCMFRQVKAIWSLHSRSDRRIKQQQLARIDNVILPN
jgi:hypothetical protein